MITVKRAVNEGSKRDTKRDRLVLVVGENQYHITRQEAAALKRQLERFVLPERGAATKPIQKGDKAVIDALHARFGHLWFTCRDSKLGRARVEALVQRGLLESGRESGTHVVNYRVHP
jgi:hypothetical protein